MQLFSIKYLTQNFNETRINYSLLFVYLFSVFIIYFVLFMLWFIIYILIHHLEFFSSSVLQCIMGLPSTQFALD